MAHWESDSWPFLYSLINLQLTIYIYISHMWKGNKTIFTIYLCSSKFCFPSWKVSWFIYSCNFKQYFKKKLLKDSRCTTLCSFQVNNIAVRHLNALWNDHHNKSSNHQSPYKGIAVVLTSCYIIYPSKLFYKWNFVPLNALHLFHSTSHSTFLPLFIYESVSVLFSHLFCCF